MKVVEGLGFGIIWLQNDINIIQHRNSVRDTDITNEDIVKMAAKFETLTNEERSYEIKTCDWIHLLDKLHETSRKHKIIEPTLEFVSSPVHDFNLKLNEAIHRLVSKSDDKRNLAQSLHKRKRELMELFRVDITQFTDCTENDLISILLNDK